MLLEELLHCATVDGYQLPEGPGHPLDHHGLPVADQQLGDGERPPRVPTASYRSSIEKDSADEGRPTPPAILRASPSVHPSITDLPNSPRRSCQGSEGVHVAPVVHLVAYLLEGPPAHKAKRRGMGSEQRDRSPPASVISLVPETKRYLDHLLSGELPAPAKKLVRKPLPAPVSLVHLQEGRDIGREAPRHPLSSQC